MGNDRLSKVSNIAQIVGILLALLAILATFFVPEVRQFFGLEKPVEDTPTPLAPALRPTDTPVPHASTSEPTGFSMSPTEMPRPTDAAATPSASINSPPPIAQIGQTWVRPADGAVMVPVPKERFLMGSTDAQIQDAVTECVANGFAEADCKTWIQAESPQHRVILDAFWIDRTERTNEEYLKCVEAGACPEPGCSGESISNAPDQPVICVTWNNAAAYCAWAGARLPTEAEWEKAARGKDGRHYPWGTKAPDCNTLNFSSGEGLCVGNTTPVGSFPAGASPYGVLDMAGNVWEWVNDWYDEGYYANSPLENPLGPESGEVRVLRGGSWIGSSTGGRSAFRNTGAPSYSSDNVGFRCALSAASSP